MSPLKNSDEEVEARVGRIVQRLREQGHRITPQRLAIIQTFISDPTHPTAEQIYEGLRQLFPTMAVSTVYNTLGLLVQLGEAVEVSPATRETRFDPHVADHCHLVCLRCNAIVDVECPGIVAWEDIRAEATRRGFKVVRQVHEIYGLCGRCAGANE